MRMSTFTFGGDALAGDALALAVFDTPCLTGCLTFPMLQDSCDVIGY